MMPDIFTSFDPATMHLSSACTSVPSFSMSFLFTPTIWFTPNFLSLLSLYTASLMWAQLSQISFPRLKGAPSLLPSLFSLLIFLNLLGFTSHIFAATSHLMITASLGLPLWLCLIILSITLNPYMFLTSLLPSSPPAWLNPFLTPMKPVKMNLPPLSSYFPAFLMTLLPLSILITLMMLSTKLTSPPPQTTITGSAIALYNIIWSVLNKSLPSITSLLSLLKYGEPTLALIITPINWARALTRSRTLLRLGPTAAVITPISPSPNPPPLNIAPPPDSS